MLVLVAIPSAITFGVSLRDSLSEVPIASCFPSTKESEIFQSFVQCKGPNNGSWQYNEAHPRQRECLDAECQHPVNHIQVNWRGPPLFKYTLVFRIRMTGSIGDGVQVILSTGGKATIARDIPDVDRPYGQFPVANILEDGIFHHVTLRANASLCSIEIDTVLLAEIPGTEANRSANPRMCGAIGPDTKGIIFGGYVTANGRSVYSRVSGDVKDVVLLAGRPSDQLTSLNVIEFSANFPHYSVRPFEMEANYSWDAERLEMWSRLEGVWQGSISSQLHDCSNSSVKATCCSDQVVEEAYEFHFFRGRASRPMLQREGGVFSNSSLGDTVTLDIDWDSVASGVFSIATVHGIGQLPGIPGLHYPADCMHIQLMEGGNQLEVKFSMAQLRLDVGVEMLGDWILCPANDFPEQDVISCRLAAFAYGGNIGVFTFLGLLRKADVLDIHRQGVLQEDTATFLPMAFAVSGIFVSVCLGILAWRTWRGRLPLQKTVENAVIEPQQVPPELEVQDAPKADFKSPEVFVSAADIEEIVQVLGDDWLLQSDGIQLYEVIGEGGFGSVRRGRLFGATPVAVKMAKNRSSSKQARALANEVSMLKRVRHPNIVLILGLAMLQDDEESGGLALVFEWVEGGDLKHYMRRPVVAQPTCLGDELKILLDVCRGMDYLHSQRPMIMHRDIKPENILIESMAPPRAKISDFGLSRVMVSEHAIKRAGTTRYMAPEVRQGRRYTIMADVYSFGCVVYFVLCARYPEFEEIFQGKRSMRISPGNDVQEGFTQVAECCMQERPELRPDFHTMYEVMCRLGSSTTDASNSSSGTFGLSESYDNSGDLGPTKVVVSM